MANDTICIRGQGPRTGEVKGFGGGAVTFADDAGQRQLPAWTVSSFDLAGTPDELRVGLDLLSGARFDEAVQAFEAVPAGPDRAGWFKGWGQFHAANARRIAAEVSGTGHAEAAKLLAAFVAGHAGDPLVPHALLAQAHAARAAGDLEQASAALTALDIEAFGPVWRLHAELGRAWLTLEAGKHADARAKLEELAARAAEVEHAGEVRRLAQAWIVEALRRAGDFKGALEAVPHAPADDGSEQLAVLSSEWLGSPATPLLLNTIGQALRQLWTGAEGAAAAAPFHLRVTRYFPTHHVEHARALAFVAACFNTCGQTDWQGAMVHSLRERYPGAPRTSSSAPGPLGR